MKRTMFFTIYLLFVIALIFVFRSAWGAEIEVQAGKSTYEMEAIKSGNSIKAMVLHNGLYAALENETFMLYGQDMAMNSLSVGYRHQFKALPLYIYGQGGYYRPDYDPAKFGREAIYMAICKEYNYPSFSMYWSDHYELHIRPGFGAEIGAGLNLPLWKRISLNLSTGYRYLRLWADYDGLDTLGRQDWIMSRQDNFDAVKLYGGINYEF